MSSVGTGGLQAEGHTQSDEVRDRLARCCFWSARGIFFFQSEKYKITQAISCKMGPFNKVQELMRPVRAV